MSQPCRGTYGCCQLVEEDPLGPSGTHYVIGYSYTLVQLIYIYDHTFNLIECTTYIRIRIHIPMIDDIYIYDDLKVLASTGCSVFIHT